tara:strand:+ start:1355 stop:1531 length:177 start_codon:yes stop_codon:yes gene_type:complete
MTAPIPFTHETDFFTIDFASKSEYNKVKKFLKREGITLDYFLFEFDVNSQLGTLKSVT